MNDFHVWSLYLPHDTHTTHFSSSDIGGGCDMGGGFDSGGCDIGGGCDSGGGCDGGGTCDWKDSIWNYKSEWTGLSDLKLYIFSK